jgi:hypothetical protein
MRDNGNAGTMTTPSNALFGNYGVISRHHPGRDVPPVRRTAGTLGSLRAMATASLSQPHTLGGVTSGGSAHTFHRRPSQLDPSILAVIGLPNFPSCTPGHSTFSSAAATVLSSLFPNAASVVEGKKEDASISRLYGGIHYRSDIEIGREHGKRIGGDSVRFAQLDGADVRQ